MSSLSKYITSKVKGLWNDQPLSEKWVEWHDKLSKLVSGGITFNASTEDEFLEKLVTELPHLSGINYYRRYHRLTPGESEKFSSPSLLRDFSCNELVLTSSGYRMADNCLDERWCPVTKDFKLEYVETVIYSESELEHKAEYFFSRRYAGFHWGDVLGNMDLIDHRDAAKYNVYHSDQKRSKWKATIETGKTDHIYPSEIEEKKRLQEKYSIYLFWNDNLGVQRHYYPWKWVKDPNEQDPEKIIFITHDVVLATELLKPYPKIQRADYDAVAGQSLFGLELDSDLILTPVIASYIKENLSVIHDQYGLKDCPKFDYELWYHDFVKFHKKYPPKEKIFTPYCDPNCIHCEPTSTSREN